MQTVLWFIVAWALASVLLPPLIALSWRIGALDVPRDRRRMHRDSVPRLGGVAVFFTLLIVLPLSEAVTVDLRYTLAGAAIVFAVGLADDLFTLPAWLKLFFQLIAAAFAVGGSGYARGVWVFAAVFWVILLTNAHNLIDGLDGLFAGAAVIEGIGLFILLGALGKQTLAPLLLAAACLGFRAGNRAPARIFAGDCGSGTVGFLLAMFSLPAFEGSWSLGFLAPIFLMAYPIADLTAAVLRRTLRGKPLFAADRGHLHHRLAATGIGTAECGRILLAVCASFTAVGVLLARWEWELYAAAACVGAVGVLLAMRAYVLRHAAKENVGETVDFQPKV